LYRLERYRGRWHRDDFHAFGGARGVQTKTCRISQLEAERAGLRAVITTLEPLRTAAVKLRKAEAASSKSSRKQRSVAYDDVADAKAGVMRAARELAEKGEPDAG